MSRSRAQSVADSMPKEPHLVSLKVLRLSRPSLAEQYPLPLEDPRSISSLSFPSPASDPSFSLSPVLTLPPAFGSTHVGETFTCSICANNEISPDDRFHKIKSLSLSAEIQTPSQTVPLQLHSNSQTSNEDTDADEEEDTDTNTENESPSKPGSSIQRIIKFDLKEEGNHVLAVNVSYTESLTTGNRPRTFRKLYQFIAQPCLSVRTKASELPQPSPPPNARGKEGTPKLKPKLLRFALEAQLENVAETTITLEQTRLEVCPPFRATSLNWDATISLPSPPSNNSPSETPPSLEKPILTPHDIIQLAFLVEQVPGVTEGLDVLRSSIQRDGRVTLGQLSIEWRGAMGERGFLTTGNLLSRRGVA